MKKRFLVLIILAVIFLILKNDSYAQENNKIKILFYSQPPYHYTTIDGKICGIWPEIIKECLQNKYQLEFVETNSYDQVYNNIINKKYDIGLSIEQYATETKIEKIYPEIVVKSYILWVSSIMNLNQPHFKDINKLPYQKFGQITSVKRQDFTDKYKLVKSGSINHIFYEMDHARIQFTICDFFDGTMAKYGNRYSHVRETQNVIYREALFPFVHPDNLGDSKWCNELQDALNDLSIDEQRKVLKKYQKLVEHILLHYLYECKTKLLFKRRYMGVL